MAGPLSSTNRVDSFIAQFLHSSRYGANRIRALIERSDCPSRQTTSGYCPMHSRCKPSILGHTHSASETTANRLGSAIRAGAFTNADYSARSSGITGALDNYRGV